MKLWNYLLNKSFRWKIMVSISAVILARTLCLAFTIVVNHISQGIIADSYKSNAELTEFSTSLSDLENALETYAAYRTFESIDAYFNASVRVNNFRDTMQHYPSEDKVRQKEYIVYKLSGSFLEYSGKAVAERRANSENNTDYEKSLGCYTVLLNEISNLNILLMQNNADIYMENRETLNFITTSTVFFFIIYFGMVLVFLYTLVSQITQPLAEISSVATTIAERDFNVPLFNRTTQDEIGKICRAFDGMILSIREYIDTIWEKARTENELREKEIEMQALYSDAQLRAYQNQINPHFLFNTLNTGAQLAMMEGADKTCYFIEQTSDFFRYNLQEQKQSATISEELGLVDNFVYIMKVRFGKRLVFEKQVPEKDFPEQIPLMTLQPLVENCIKHGLQNMHGKVILSVIDNDDFVEISVSDNGSGMPENVRKEVLEKSKADILDSTKSLSDRTFANSPVTSDNDERTDSGEKHTGIGLINVFSRLRLFYHRDDIFDITSNKDGLGTRFIIRIPKNV